MRFSIDKTFLNKDMFLFESEMKAWQKGREMKIRVPTSLSCED